jgi:anaerobic selenocysteine-containing dehydrogenase
VAEKFAAIRDEHGGDKIFYYGGGGQGNHLPGAYSRSTLSVLGNVYRSNALAQEKTGEFWVNGKMFGGIVRGDFEHCEVGVFIGKNPWHSHSIPQARVTLKEIKKDPGRKMITIDPKRTETADMSDIHLAVRPGADAWLLAALVAVIVQEDMSDKGFIEEHVVSMGEVLPFFEMVPVEEYAEKAGVPVEQVREAARMMAGAESVAFFEDLGVQMNRHSTLVSYLNRILWILTGSYGKKGSMGAPIPFHSLVGKTPADRPDDGSKPRGRVSPVAGARIISGLVPCNVIAEEVLSDHPDRYRAMLIESGNPAHSLANSPRFRAALDALELVVVIDIAMTETARCADYILPVASQYEKAEAVFFNFEFPENAFYLRKPLLEPVPGVLTEPEIHTRIVEHLGALPTDVIDELRAALGESRERFAQVFFERVAPNPDHMAVVPSILYRTLGEVLPRGAESAAAVWGMAHMCALRNPEAVKAAGFEGGRQDQRGRPGALRHHPLPRDHGACRAHGRVPALPVGRRTPLVHGQYDPPPPRLEEEGPRGRAVHPPRRRRSARTRAWRAGAADHEDGAGGGGRGAQRPHAARPRVAAQWNGPLELGGRPGGNSPQRADGLRGSRRVRRHPLAQVCPGPLDRSVNPTGAIMRRCRPETATRTRRSLPLARPRGPPVMPRRHKIPLSRLG